MLIRRTQILIEVEATPGTWDAPDAADGVLAYDVVATPEFAMFKQDPQGKLLSRYKSLSGIQSGTITFRLEIRGHGSTENPPDNHEIVLEACGFSEANGRLEPTTTQPGSVSIQVEEDGMVGKYKGCLGNVRFIGVVGEPMFYEFTFRGTIEDITSGSLTTLTGLPTTVPPVLLSASFSTSVSSAESHIINSIEFDMQNEIAFSTSVSETTGIYRAYITGKNPVGSFDPEYNTSFDWLDRIITNDLGGLYLELGSVTNNRCMISCPNIRFMAMDPGDREGVRILTVPFEMNKTKKDSGIILEFGCVARHSGTKYDIAVVTESISFLFEPLSIRCSDSITAVESVWEAKQG